MSEQSPTYLEAASEYLKRLGVTAVEQPVRDQMVRMSDLAVYLLLAGWLAALEADEAQPGQVAAALGELGRVVGEQSQSGESESVLAAVYDSGDLILFEGLLALGIAAIKYVNWQAKRAGRVLSDGFLDEGLAELVTQTVARYQQAGPAEQQAYRGELTPLRFAAVLLEEVRVQAQAAGMDLTVVSDGDLPAESGAAGAPPEAALTPEQYLQFLMDENTPPETIADIMLDAFRPLLTSNAAPQYKKYGRGAVSIDLRGPSIEMMFVPQPALQAQAQSLEPFQAIAATVATYDPHRQFVAYVLQADSVFFYQLDLEKEE